MENEDCPAWRRTVPCKGMGSVCMGTIAALLHSADDNIIEQNYENCGEIVHACILLVIKYRMLYKPYLF